MSVVEVVEVEGVENEVVLESYVTGYKLTSLLKEMTGLERNPQMVYNYLKKGLIKSEVVNGQRLVRMDVGLEWIEKFGKRNGISE